MFPGVVEVYEVRAPFDGASALARNNPRWGQGDGELAFIPDEAFESGALTKVDDLPGGEHHFDPGTRRSTIEDPDYARADPSLPQRALDPGEAGQAGEAARAGREAAATMRNTGVAATVTTINDQEGTTPP